MVTQSPLLASAWSPIVFGLEDARAHHKDISSSPRDISNVLDLDPSVHFYFPSHSGSVDGLLELLNFFKGRGHKRLTPNPGLTDIRRTRSISSSTGKRAFKEVAGLSTNPGLIFRSFIRLTIPLR